MSDFKSISISQEAGLTVAAFRPEYSQLDETEGELISRELKAMVDGLARPALVIDMSHVEFFGSSFIESLFGVWKRLSGKPGAKFGLCGLKPYCREVLEVTHLDQVWKLFPTRKEALDQLGSRTPA